MITLPSTVFALRLAVIGAAVAAAVAAESYLEQRADERTGMRIDRAFGAALWMPTGADLGAAMRPMRSDRDAVSEPRRDVRSVTVEQRRGDASSDLLRIATTELAQR